MRQTPAGNTLLLHEQLRGGAQDAVHPVFVFHRRKRADGGGGNQLMDARINEGDFCARAYKYSYGCAILNIFL